MPNTLIKLSGWRRPPELRQALGKLLSSGELETLDVMHAIELGRTYAYLDLAAPDSIPQRDTLRHACRSLCEDAELLGLQCTLDLPGHSFGTHAEWHYIVETDVRPEAEDDFNAWYRGEHMPGLAAVPGTAQAWRYLSEGSPRHYAAYDLARREAFGSPPWIAVRATPWSSRVRPNFFNTQRIMFRRAAGPAGD